MASMPRRARDAHDEPHTWREIKVGRNGSS
jgi:hypothetical protein